MAKRQNFRSTSAEKSTRLGVSALSSSSLSPPSTWYTMLSPKQKKAADFVINRGKACLLCEQGTGKTIIVLAVLEKLKWARVLIVTPLTSIHVTWRRRLKEQWPVHTELSSDEGVSVVGYEFFRNNIKRILKIKWDIVIFDESQLLKDRGSKQSRAARRLRLKTPVRIILSGTPIDDSPIDLWAQLRFVEPLILSDRWSDFEARFLRETGFMGYQREMRPECTGEFLKAIAPACFRLTIDDIQRPPEIIEIGVRLRGRQRRIYDQMNIHGIVRIDGFKSKAGLTITKDLRLFQIVGGYLSNDDTEIFTGEAKQRKLEWLIKRLERPVVFCRFINELDDVTQILKKRFKRVAYLDGSVKNKKGERNKLLKDWQDKKLDALACQTRTGGVSVEFHSSYELVFYSMGYSYIDFQQIISRFRRWGQEKIVKVYLIVARDTIDEQPLERIRQKSETVNPIMDFIEEKSNG